MKLESPILAVEEYTVVDETESAYVISCMGMRTDTGDLQNMGMRHIAKIEGQSADETIIAALSDPDYDPRPRASLEELRAQALEAAKLWRETQLSQGFEFRGRRIQTRNAADCQNIVETFLASQIDSNMVTQWRCEDNSWLELDRAGIAELAMTFAAFKQGVWEKFRSLTDKIQDAKSKDSLPVF